MSAIEKRQLPLKEALQDPVKKVGSRRTFASDPPGDQGDSGENPTDEDQPSAKKRKEHGGKKKKMGRIRK